jgi:hypothetical protein
VRPKCQPEDVDRALARLRAENATAPRTLPPPGIRGVYAWYVDREGAENLAEGLDHEVQPGLIFTGQAGATRWPPGRPARTTLRSRIGHQLRGDVRSSAFRFTLAAALRSSTLVVVLGPRRLTLESEHLLREWMSHHLTVATSEHHPDTLADLESQVLKALDPPLNLEGVAPTALRQAVHRERAELVRGAQRFISHPVIHAPLTRASRG